MDYEEMIKEAFRFKRLGLRQRIGRLFGKKVEPQRLSPKQSNEGQMFDKMMSEFVQANPRLAEKASGGASQQLTKKWQKHQQKFLKDHELTESMMRARLPKSPQVLAKQVKRHHRRATRATRKQQEAGAAPDERFSPGAKATIYGGSGLAIGATGASRASDNQSSAGYAGGGAYGR